MSEMCRLGGLTLDVTHAALLRDGTALPLGRRAVLLLLHLVRHRGAIVPKEVLYQAAWPGQAVEESNLTVQMSHLRRVLEAEQPGGRTWVETLPRRGYRYVGPADWGPADWDPADRGAAAPAPCRGGTVSNIPVAVPLHLAGREAALEAMRAALNGARGGPPAVALHGMRGLGKTMLAAAFAAAFAGEGAGRYRVTWWVRAEAAATARADLAALAVRLGWAPAAAPEAFALDAALDRLRQEGEGVLLIYDDAPDAAGLRPFLPKAGGAHVVVTSNSGAWRAVATPIEPELWSPRTGAAFLLARTGRVGEEAAATALSRLLGGLPLAHEQAAAYVESLGLPLADYGRRLEAEPARVLGDAAYAPGDYHGGLTVAKALHLAIGQARARHPAAEPLLRHVALLAAEPVPLALFCHGAAALDPALAAALAGDGLDEAVAVLRRLGLVNREQVPDEQDPDLLTDSVRLHRLVRGIVASGLEVGQAGPVRAALTAALAATYPADVFDARTSWPLARRLDPLAIALVAPPAAIAPGAEAAAIKLLAGVASYRHGPLGAYREAEALFGEALKLSEAIHGPRHEMTGTLLNNLALLLRDGGDLARARPMYERALAIREAVFGPDHPEVAVCLNNLGNAVSEAGHPAEAVPLLERALAIGRAHSGEEHRFTALLLNNLARHLHLAGDLDRARPLQRRALQLRERLLGLHDPQTAASLSNWALLLLDDGQMEEAAGLAGRALGVMEAALGAGHPLITSACATYARCVLTLHGPAAALPHAERAVALGTMLLAPGSATLRRAAAVLADCRNGGTEMQRDLAHDASRLGEDGCRE